jgi:hypothetical protein
LDSLLDAGAHRRCNVGNVLEDIIEGDYIEHFIRPDAIREKTMPHWDPGLPRPLEHIMIRLNASHVETTRGGVFEEESITGTDIQHSPRASLRTFHNGIKNEFIVS